MKKDLSDVEVSQLKQQTESDGLQKIGKDLSSVSLYLREVLKDLNENEVAKLLSVINDKMIFCFRQSS
jgi:phosphoenolpyruvate carboxylase